MTSEMKEHEAEIRGRLIACANRDYAAIQHAKANAPADILFLLSLADSLRSELEKAKEDTERIDWLANNAAMITKSGRLGGGEGNDYWLFYPDDKADGHCGDTFHDPRHAIDAAIQDASDAEFDAANPRPYPCGAFRVCDGKQCLLASDHGEAHRFAVPQPLLSQESRREG